MIDTCTYFARWVRIGLKGCQNLVWTHPHVHMAKTEIIYPKNVGAPVAMNFT